MGVPISGYHGLTGVLLVSPRTLSRASGANAASAHRAPAPALGRHPQKVIAAAVLISACAVTDGRREHRLAVDLPSNRDSRCSLRRALARGRLPIPPWAHRQSREGRIAGAGRYRRGVAGPANRSAQSANNVEGCGQCQRSEDDRA